MLQTLLVDPLPLQSHVADTETDTFLKFTPLLYYSCPFCISHCLSTALIVITNERDHCRGVTCGLFWPYSHSYRHLRVVQMETPTVAVRGGGRDADKI